MHKTKIAVFIDWYLPGTKAGGPVRSVYSLIEVLKEHYEFYLITRNSDLGSVKQYENIVADKLVAQNGVHYFYGSERSLNKKSVVDLLDTIKPDLIYLNSFWSFYFSILLVRLRNQGKIKTPILLAPRGMLGKGALGLKSFKKTSFLKLSRLLNWYKGIIFHASQPQEQKDIASKFQSNKIILAQNINSGTVVPNRSIKANNGLRLFYLSRISRVKNLHFALLALKEISNQFSITYDIYGNLEDTEYWAECIQIIKDLPAHIKVQQKGELQFDQVQNIISSYNVLFLPTLNENFGHSIVESLMCGCPVIISDQTPWTDVRDYKAGIALPLADTAAFSKAIEYYAALTAEEFVAQSKSAADYISKRIHLDILIQQYKTLFNDSIQN